MTRSHGCLRIFIILFTLVSLSGCKEVLYSNLDEREVNQMVAVLQAADVPSSRKMNTDGLYDILVEKNQIGASVLLLQNEGLPRQKFADLGEVFQDKGIVGTPFQERARFMYALNQELSSTIANIDGVQEARVHIVLPETQRFDRSEQNATAAVAIYYQSGFDAQTIVPTVKNMLAHAVPDLSYDGVSVSLFDVGGAQLMVKPSRLSGAAEASEINAPSTLTLSPNGSGSSIWIALAVIAAILAIIIPACLKIIRKIKYLFWGHA